MSPEHQRLDLSDRVPEEVGFDLRQALRAKPRAMALRFVAGALASIISGLLGLLFGEHIGGIPLALPAVLVASLTLIEEQEDSEEAREDARGAIAGACALTAFAVVAALTFGHLPGGVALALAAVGWVAVSIALYVALWWR